MSWYLEYNLETKYLKEKLEDEKSTFQLKIRYLQN